MTFSIQQQISMVRGDTKAWAFQVVDENASPISLASHSGLWFTAKRLVSDVDASAIFQKHLATGLPTGGGFAIASAALGYGTVTLSPTDTSSLDAAIVQLSYDLQFVDVGGNKYTVAEGKLTVRPDVTLS